MFRKKANSILLATTVLVNLFVFSQVIHASESTISGWASEDYSKAIKLNLVQENSGADFKKPLTGGEFMDLCLRLSQVLSSSDDTVISKIKNEQGALDEEITRERAAYILASVLNTYQDKLDSAGDSKIVYKDAEKINPDYLPAVEYLTANHIFSGYEGAFHPEEKLYYEQALAVVTRAYEQLGKEVELFVGNHYQGFALKEKLALEVKDADMYVFEHLKTGAQLIFIRNKDENKTFSITFRTPPENSKGIQHITEHMVLNGSEKYPVKDIFFNIWNGSTLATYLNAWTYPVFTAYPIASANTTDFNNLMGVYLDAVYNPLFKNHRNIFLQEGIRKDIDPATYELEFNGIVYNEMKAILGNVEWTMYLGIIKSLFPDTPYAYHYGGSPQEIETLTYEELMDYYSKHYHPSNSMVYLYGDVDIIDRLKYINENIYSQVDKTSIEKINYDQPSFEKEVEATIQYAVEDEVGIEDQYIFSLAFAVNQMDDYAGTISMDLLSGILNSSGSSLEKALAGAGLSTNYDVSIDTFPKQNTLTFTLHNARLKDKEPFKEVVFHVMDEITKNGIDVDQANKILDSGELKKATDTLSVNSGIDYIETVAKNWLYDAPLTQNFNTKKATADLRKSLNPTYFSDMIKKYILENKHAAYITWEPSSTYAKDWKANSDAGLEAYRESLTEEEISNHLKETDEFNQYMSTPNHAEDLATLPTVPISQLETDVKKTGMTEKELDGVKILRRDDGMGSLLHLNYLFKSSHIPQDKTMVLSLVMDLLGKLDTKNYKVNSLENELFSRAKVGFYNTAYVNKDDQAKYSVKNVVSLDTLADNLEDVNSLILEIMYHTDFSDSDRIKKNVSEIKSRYESDDPINLLTSQLYGYVSDGDAYGANTRGLAYYGFIKEIEGLLASEPEKVIAELQNVYRLAFPQEGLMINLLGTEANNNIAEPKLTVFSKGLQDVSAPDEAYDFNMDTSEGFKANISVQYNGFISDYKKLGYEYSGKLEVLKKIIDNYLGVEIRSKNGAYGASFVIDKNNMMAYSYRDPELSKTYEIFKSIPDYIQSLKLTDSELQAYIIAAYRTVNPLVDVISRNGSDLAHVLNGTDPDQNKVIAELLSTTKEDIKSFVPMLRDVVKNWSTAAVGNSSLMEENADLFKHIKKYLE